MNIHAITTVFLALVFTSWSASNLPAADKPNVVLMLADNVGWGDIGVYGGVKFVFSLDSLIGLRLWEARDLSSRLR